MTTTTSWERQDWLDLQADKATAARIAAEEAAVTVDAEGACPICGHPSTRGDLCRPCDQPAFGPDAYGNLR